ncbi:MAG: acyltransferase [Clostridia bacterium]|nr:acyltransferase [Clostridia bacterium]
MCKSAITLKKFLKLLLEYMFYKITITVLLWILGYGTFSFKSLFFLFIPVKDVSDGFVGTYLIFFLTIPFLNVLIRHLNERQHIKLLLLSGFTYVFISSIPWFSVTMNYVSWFIVLYFFASYIRLYPKALFDKTKIWGWSSIVCVILCIASVVVGALIYVKTGENYTYFFVADSNKILALCSGICFFMFFKNIKLKYNRMINTVASSTFGILLIHAHSDEMRECIWVGAFKNVKNYGSDILPLHAVGSVIAVFSICFVIDRLRIIIIEKPFFRFIDKYLDKMENSYHNFEDRFMSKISRN